MERPANLVARYGRAEYQDEAASARDAAVAADPGAEVGNGSNSNNRGYMKVRDELRDAARTFDDLEQEVRGDLVDFNDDAEVINR